MTLRTFTLAAGFALCAVTPAVAQGGYLAPPIADAVAPVFPWYLDPEEIGPLAAPNGDTIHPLYTYAGDEDAGDFAARYGCKPVWDGGIDAYVPACAH